VVGVVGCFEYSVPVNLMPILATSVGIAIYHGLVSPLIGRYRGWRNGPRVQTARPNWRGVYVPDLTLKRTERMFWVCCIAFFVLGLAIAWTVMVPTG
jgi:hypothetical protein